MKRILQLSFLNYGSASLIRGLARFERAATGRTANSTKGLVPWVARIVGSDPQWGMRREFLKGNHDFSEADKRGQGVGMQYLLEDGSVYEFYEPLSKGDLRRGFFRFIDGAREEIARDRVISMIPESIQREDVPTEPEPRPRRAVRKQGLGTDVLSAARERISWAFDHAPRICISFSGGKDSTVMTHLVMEEAIKRGRKVGLLFIDLEAQYTATIEHVQEMFDLYAEHIEPYWVSLPLALRNAVSQYEPRWMCWDPQREADWVRNAPEIAIKEPGPFAFFRPGMEFEEFVDDFAVWFGGGELTACFIGIRADESLNRFRTLAMDKARMDGKRWTTWKGRTSYNIYPIYDWKTEDIWVYHAKTGKPHNRLYDLMHKAGLTIHQMRICQPYGDDQRKGLWLYHVIEPETWGKIVARVNGANSGSMYAHTSGNMAGMLKIAKPPGHTWESFAKLLLESLPPKSKEHYEGKIATFIHWYSGRGYQFGIPDEATTEEEASKKIPSWRRVCKALLRNDYWCKGLSFSQNKSESYERYLRILKQRRNKWGI